MQIVNDSVVLVLAPHTDDGELGLGGTIHSLIRRGCDVHYVGFSAAEESIPPGFRRGQTRAEVMDATATLGMSEDKVKILSFKVREFGDSRQKILDAMIEVRSRLQPDIVFVPSTDDIHQDHKVVCTEAIRAFKNRTILGYELIWNEFSFKTQLLITLERNDIEAKVDALACYATQAGRPYMSPDFIYGLARARGVQVGGEFAEAFEVIRCVM